jgi:hypothetical protein
MHRFIYKLQTAKQMDGAVTEKTWEAPPATQRRPARVGITVFLGCRPQPHHMHAFVLFGFARAAGMHEPIGGRACTQPAGRFGPKKCAWPRFGRARGAFSVAGFRPVSAAHVASSSLPAFVSMFRSARRHLC